MSEDPRRQRKVSTPPEDLPSARNVTLAGFAALGLIVSMGLASTVDNPSGADRGPSAVAGSPTGSATPAATPSASPGRYSEITSPLLRERLLELPDATTVAPLVDGPLQVGDSTISFILTADGSGKSEYGIHVEGPSAAAIEPGELVLRTASGLTFTPTELYLEGDVLNTTINAFHGDEDFVTIEWVDNSKIRLFLYRI